MWRETWREGTVQYVEGDTPKKATYTYRIGLELMSSTGKDLPCPGTAVAQAEPSPGPSTPYPTDTPYPTYTPNPTYTPDPTYTSNPTYTPQPPTPEPSPNPSLDTSLPFSDDFDFGVGEGWSSEGGDWNMANGRLVNTGSSSVLWLGKKTWTDVIVEFESYSAYCSDLVQALVRMQDPFNFVAVRVAGCNNEGTYLYKDGKQEKRMVSALGRGTHWRIEVFDSVYRVIVDGNVRSTSTDDTFSSGSVGIQMGKGGAIDNFSVRAYEP